MHLKTTASHSETIEISSVALVAGGCSEAGGHEHEGGEDDKDHKDDIDRYEGNNDGYQSDNDGYTDDNGYEEGANRNDRNENNWKSDSGMYRMCCHVLCFLLI